MKNIKLVQHRKEFGEEIYRLSSAPAVKEALGLPDGTVEDTFPTRWNFRFESRKIEQS